MAQLVFKHSMITTIRSYMVVFKGMEDLQEQANKYCQRYSKETVKHDDENYKIGGMLKSTGTVKEHCQIVTEFDSIYFIDK